MSIEKYNGESGLAKIIQNLGALFNSRAAKSTQINGHTLETDINLTAEDVGALNSTVSTGTIDSTGSEWSENNSIIRKQGNIVYVYLDIKKNANTNAASTVMTLPVGFRPSRTIYFGGDAGGVMTQQSTKMIRITSDGVMTYMFTGGGINAGKYYGTLSFLID
ncbi:MAG: hypothetical protein IJD14_04900 [Christensenellaceae bacterium]|nr:hypothetical protein [Christensenellaceae bacterium]